MASAISVESLSKMFVLRTSRPRTIRESLIKRMSGLNEPPKTVWALHDVSFRLERGKALGVIGHNGAGKSTLLRLLCGIGKPTTGSILRDGSVSGLLELGTSFHPMMSGRENIRTAAMLNGLNKRQALALEQEMIEFAELEDFIDQPVRTYSNGMCLRLAFAAAIYLDPDILIIDEILVVGDIRFQQKCEERLDQFRKEGKTLVITSHRMDQIENFCDEAVVLEEGRIGIHSDPRTAVAFYKDLMRQRTEKRIEQLSSASPVILEQPEKGFRTGTQEASIAAVRFHDDFGDPLDNVEGGGGLTIDLDITVTTGISDVAVTLGIFAANDQKCFETFIPSIKDLLGHFQEKITIQCKIRSLPLLTGVYFVNAGLYPLDWKFTYDYHREMHSFHVTNNSNNVNGIVAVQPEWSVRLDPVVN
jgi:lipopolysaccharide transport system ATP-binding protein